MCYVVTVEKKHMKMNYELNCFDLGIRVSISQGWEPVFAVIGQRWGTGLKYRDKQAHSHSDPRTL